MVVNQEAIAREKTCSRIVRASLGTKLTLVVIVSIMVSNALMILGSIITSEPRLNHTL